jgi:Rrf2 family protein
MLRISTKSQYGLRAMVYLARYRDKVCPLKLISKKEKISFDYLEKIISKLEKSGLIKSKKGSQGGYFLAKNPKKIKINQIIRTLEGEKNLVKCLSKNYRCPLAKRCLTKNFWQKIQKSLEKTLNSITLADLVKK